jgi:hypothetical protein
MGSGVMIASGIIFPSDGKFTVSESNHVTQFDATNTHAGKTCRLDSVIGKSRKS